MLEKLEQLGLEDTEFIHPYAHPKKPGAKEDHLGR
jgi:ketosteroid isomerase-like protein